MIKEDQVMGQIDFNEINRADTVDQTKQGELSIDESADVEQSSVELTDNIQEGSENIDESADVGQQGKEADEMVIVTYVGGGVWKDGRGELWSVNKVTDGIVDRRKYNKGVYDTRDDLKFMVRYGAMTVYIV